MNTRPEEGRIEGVILVLLCNRESSERHYAERRYHFVKPD